MSSRVHVIRMDGKGGEVNFILPIKGVFGRMLCGTDGTIGEPTEFSPEMALEIVKQCEELIGKYPGDDRDLAKIRKWAEAGHTLFAHWVH